MPPRRPNPIPAARMARKPANRDVCFRSIGWLVTEDRNVLSVTPCPRWGVAFRRVCTHLRHGAARRRAGGGDREVQLELGPRIHKDGAGRQGQGTTATNQDIWNR